MGKFPSRSNKFLSWINFIDAIVSFVVVTATPVIVQVNRLTQWCHASVSTTCSMLINFLAAFVYIALWHWQTLNHWKKLARYINIYPLLYWTTMCLPVSICKTVAIWFLLLRQTKKSKSIMLYLFIFYFMIVEMIIIKVSLNYVWLQNLMFTYESPTEIW